VGWVLGMFRTAFLVARLLMRQWLNHLKDCRFCFVVYSDQLAFFSIVSLFSRPWYGVLLRIAFCQFYGDTTI
jgi:hypothetical protein